MPLMNILVTGFSAFFLVLLPAAGFVLFLHNRLWLWTHRRRNPYTLKSKI